MNSGKCDSFLAYDLGDKNYGDDDNANDAYYNTDQNKEEIQCSFIESIRYGTYDAYGEIYVSNSQEINQKASVTLGQKFGLTFVSMICVSLAFYSCYLHHSMTNLLLKSLSSGLMSKKKRSHRSSSSKRPTSRESRRSKKRPSRRPKVEESYSDEYSESTADDDSTYV